MVARAYKASWRIQSSQDELKDATKYKNFKHRMMTKITHPYIREFGLQQPPLIQQLRKILYDYQDDALLKEIIQNADDAGATEIKIVYDGRRINRICDERFPFRKFFQGPGLCVYNNEIFTEKDWDGVTKINSSVKEHDLLKVGRFGLGFKSVFHLTDHVCIISDNRILLIDPFQEEKGRKVCASISLSDVQNCQLFSVADILLALDGMFGMSKAVFDDGKYPGTIFWFSLRESPSALSDTIYDQHKIESLFKSLQIESTNNLLFLKYLERLEIYIRRTKLNSTSLPGHEAVINIGFEISDATMEPKESIYAKTVGSKGPILDLVFKLEMVDDKTMLAKRRNFLKHIEKLDEHANSDLVCHYNISFNVSVKRPDGTALDTRAETWIVLNLFKVTDMSPSLANLTKMSSLSYRPYVSVATPLKPENMPFKGHVFCFLPLPQEPKSITGLPVHLNAFFALSQNRRQIKWPSVEQEECGMYTDRDLVWNQLLLSELLPYAYALLLRRIVNYSEENSGLKDIVHTLYRSIPDVDMVERRLFKLAKCLFSFIVNDKIFFTANNGGRWISHSEAIFTNIDALSEDNASIARSVINILVTYKQNYVQLPEHIQRSLSHVMKFKYFEPEDLSRLLLKNEQYKRLLPGDKLNLLKYFFSHESYIFLKDIELLPLRDGSFTIFSSDLRKISPVYILDEDTKDLFPGLESSFVLPSISRSMKEHFKVIMKSEYFQVSLLTLETVACLIDHSIRLKARSYKEKGKASGICLGESWIQKVWKFILTRNCLSLFENIPVVPKCEKGNSEMELHRLTDKLIVKDFPGILHPLPQGVCDALGHLSVTVFTSFPDWLPLDALKMYIFFPESSSFFKLLDRLHTEIQRKGNREVLDGFNKNCPKEARNELVKYLAKLGKSSWTLNSKTLVRQLQLFRESYSCQSNHTEDYSLVSLSENDKITQTKSIPVRFPYRVIVATPDEAKLALHIGVHELSPVRINIDILKNIEQGHYSMGEVNMFLLFLFDNFYLFQNDKDIVQYLKSISFLKSRMNSLNCRVGDLFDPTTLHLQQLFLMEDKFPKTFCEEPYISILRKLGLKVDVTFDDLIETATSLHRLSVANNSEEILNVKAKAFMRILEKKAREPHCSVQSKLSSLITLKCILCMKHKPDGFPKMLPWLKMDTVLFKPTEVSSDKHIHLVGSVMPLVKCRKYTFLAKLFQWGQRPPLETVLKQLETITTTYGIHDADEASAGLQEIYTYVNEIVPYDTNSKHKVRYLHNWRCLLVNSKLMKPSEVVRHLEHNCSPYLYSLDQAEVCKFTHFLDAVGVKKHCDSTDIINALKRLREAKTKQTGPSTRLTAVELQLSINLLMTLKDTMVAENVTFENLDACLKSELYAPDADSILRHTSDLCLNDFDDEPDANVYFVHKMVSQDVATDIGIQTLRTRIYESNSIGIEFGQEEELVTRINNLLSSYPRDMGIMKELLQNADDAGATEVHFVKDYRHHSCTRVFEEKCAPIQGPALCVYSDSSFTEDDIKGIQKLGLGSKRSDPSKIGQYGIGFNSVYHITDIPSFITKDPQHDSGGILCIFDPLCKYVPQATKQKPGRRFTIKDIQTYYPDILLAYDKEFLKSERATMFRFPLRTAEMARVSKITNQEMTIQQMDGMLRNFRTDMAECLLFLKNVTKVTIENITSGTRDIEYYVDISLSKKDNAERRLFAKHIEEFGRQEKLSFTMKPREVEYTLSIKDSSGMDNSYYVVQRIGFGFSENDVPDILKEAANDGMLYNLPIGGVAVPQTIEKGLTYGEKMTGMQRTNFNDSDTGKAYCFLPLAIKTGLPFHINGHFVLDQGSRRCLWNEMSGFRKMFNETILERTVAPAYVTALEHMKSILCEVESNIKESRLQEMLDTFHKLFPIVSSAKDDYWKFLVKMTYRTIQKEKREVFVVVIPEHLLGHASLGVRVKWVSLDNDESFNPPCFNDLSKVSWRDHLKLTILLKGLGLKLLDTPINIYDSIQKSDVQTRMIEPRIVSEFLRSYKSVSSERCKITNVSEISLAMAGIDVTKTNIESVSNANLLLTYLKKMKPFLLDGLPLLVTEDGFLREFSRSRPVFISKYCNLFQNSGDLFVHHLQLEREVSVSRLNPKANSEECLVGIFPHITVHEMSPSNVFKVIRPADLPNLLTLSLDSTLCSGKIVSWDKSLLSEAWIERFWHMTCEVSSAIKEGGRPDIDPDEFCKLTTMLGNFSLLPIQNNDQCSYLLPINKGYQIVDIGSFQIGSDLRKALEKIIFQRLDFNALSNKLNSGTVFDVVSAVRYLMSSAKRPEEVLKFLEDSKNYLFRLSDDECRSILTFISDNWEEISNSKRFQKICNPLFVLPLFSTYDGKRVALKNEKTALLVHPRVFIPSDGITEWTEWTRSCILEGHQCVFELGRRLQSVQIIDVFSLYDQYIIETFEFIPHRHRIKHLEYIRDDLLKKAQGSKYSNIQWKLITKLKASACLPVNQELRKVTDFYNPENEIFELFCRDHEMLPNEYCSKKWLPFLVTCGLNNTVRDDDMIKFAIQMEHDICASPPFDLNRKSQVLVRELLRRMSKNDLISNTRMEETIWSRETKSKISKIKFIIPYTVSELYSSIHIQYKAESTLISFSGAVSSKHGTSCWTTMSLLPVWACPDNPDCYKELGIYLEPPQEAVVQHLINICHSGSANMINTELMDTLYGCLDAFGDLRSHTERLSEARIIHIPDERIFVKTNQVYLESNIPDLRPYMFKAPIDYGKYHNTLFRKLCIQKRPSFHNFLKIFQQMKDEGFEVSILERIVHTMMILKPSCTEVSDVLYLPNRNKALVNSRELIISDNQYLERRLGNEHNFQFFIELQDLGIHFQSITCFLDCLPVDLRPLLLSKIVREQVDEEEIVITISKTANRIEEHIHSQEFLRGILRLANHVRRNQGNDLSELESIEMVRNIQNTSIVAVKGLKSRLIFNDEILPNTEEEKICFYKKKDGYGYVLYMLADIAEGGLYSVLAENGGLTNLIDQCTNDILKNNFQYIHALFDNIDMPQKIHRNLDRFRIESYEMTESIATLMLPRTGTYLSKKMLPFLNQGLTMFSSNESVPVVLEVSDPVLEMTVEDVSGVVEPRYIYCRVLSQLHSATFEGLPGSEEYAVDIGGLDKSPLTVSGFKLFKILPKCRQSILDDWKTLGPHDRKMMIWTILNQIWNLTETDRRRIIKRMWLHWDPRSQDEEGEFCFEMRTLLEETLFSDDEDELLDESSIQNAKHDNDNEATRRWFKLFKTLESGVPQQASNYSIVWANQLQNRGQPIHDRERGLMWLHQAKTDQMAAEMFFPMAGEVGEGCFTYHWICYMCHQGVEKALKAAWYFKDAGEAGSHGHDLSGFARDLGSDIETVARKMENLLGHHTRMRYPSDSGTMIPARDPEYSKNTAELAIQHAKMILNYVESKFENMSENDEDTLSE
ncbi:hypothetical protein ACJMK2_044302 [Sinanodonta woodiana]|uniref:Sacsin n=1 Tax=Sinanodonta woodiana TaxID=1069815 RepID=A0ABD3VZR2_SINWO